MIAWFLKGIALYICAVSTAWAQPTDLDAALNESVRIITKKTGLFSTQLETTLYKPDGEGPFPVAVINHGKSPGDTRFQSRWRPGLAARYFLQRGYAVVVPMRQGFSKSTGSYIGGGCNVESNGRVQAEDVQAVLDYLATEPWADVSRVVVLGQSHGGWTTLAYGIKPAAGVRGLINFAGGLRQDSCVNWAGVLATAAGSYGKQTELPSLWFYGDNDSFFDPPTFQAMFDKYQAAGGHAKLVAFGKFGSDAHSMFGARNGAAIWQPEVTRFLASIGLPSAPDAAYAKFGGALPTPSPPATGFAPLEDEASLPYVRDTGRAAYKTYLAKTIPRAFAIAPNAAWGWAEGGEDPLKRALNNCNRNGNGACRLYSVDDQVVWKPDAP